MKLFKSWRVRLGAILVASSAFMYVIHYLLFHDFHHIAIYTVHDIAFLPLEVLLVTMVLHQLLESRSKREMLYKLNMVIGAFFSEVGTGLLGRLAAFSDNVEGVRDDLVVKASWTHKEYANAIREVGAYDFKIDASRGDLGALREFLVSKRDFLLRLLENPNLLEHESFTDSLWAVFHLAEELEYRTDIDALPASDLAHLSGDLKRALATLSVEWVEHLEHLQNSYPYLFSLAVRTNPLDAHARVEVTA